MMNTKTKKKILHLDDSRFALKLYRHTLKKSGALIDARTPDAAFALLEQNDIDLVLCDLNLGHSTGFDFVATLKSQEKTKSIPIILLTAHVNDNILLRSKQLGINSVLVKTEKTRVITDTILTLLNAPSQSLLNLDHIEIDGILWREGKIFFEYNPLTKHLIQSHSAEEAHDEMTEFLQLWCNSKNRQPCSYIPEIRIVRHPIRLST